MLPSRRKNAAAGGFLYRVSGQVEWLEADFNESVGKGVLIN